jgi:hypothetical protein
VSSTEAFKRVAVPILQVELLMVSTATSNPNPVVWGGGVLED